MGLEKYIDTNFLRLLHGLFVYVLYYRRYIYCTIDQIESEIKPIMCGIITRCYEVWPQKIFIVIAYKT